MHIPTRRPPGVKKGMQFLAIFGSDSVDRKCDFHRIKKLKDSISFPRIRFHRITFFNFIETIFSFYENHSFYELR